MTRFDLIAHPDFPPIAVRAVEVQVRGGRNDLLLTYRVEGADTVVLPASTRPSRADGLWKTTCFELFLKAPGCTRYFEFNFSPSAQWAAYSFQDYRTGMAPYADGADPQVQRLSTGVEVRCDVSGLPAGPLAMGLSAIIDEGSGVRSFWALAHIAGQPDFHADAAFAATLPAA